MVRLSKIITSNVHLVQSLLLLPLWTSTSHCMARLASESLLFIAMLPAGGLLDFLFSVFCFLCKVYFFTLSDRNVVTIIIWLGTRVLPLYSFSLLDCCCRCLYRLISLSRTFLRLVATGNNVLLFPSEPLVFFFIIYILCSFYHLHFLHWHSHLRNTIYIYLGNSMIFWKTSPWLLQVWSFSEKTNCRPPLLVIFRTF